jgi:hypothetical protein
MRYLGLATITVAFALGTLILTARAEEPISPWYTPFNLSYLPLPPLKKDEIKWPETYWSMGVIDPLNPPIVLFNEPGGKLAEYWERFLAYRVRKSEVRVVGKCPSACTLVLAAIERSKLCFGKDAKLLFHQAINPPPDPETGVATVSPSTTQWMINKYPEDIKKWIVAKGGAEKLPTFNNFWTLDSAELWAMGYRKCDDSAPAAQAQYPAGAPLTRAGERLGEGAYCMEQDKDGVCLRVCAAGPDKCVVREVVLPSPPLPNPDDDKWEGDFRKCHIRKWIRASDLDQMAEITPDDVPNMQKWITFLKACDAFWTCVSKRDDESIPRNKRPKHCYENDPRWRKIPEW